MDTKYITIFISIFSLLISTAALYTTRKDKEKNQEEKFLKQSIEKDLLDNFNLLIHNYDSKKSLKEFNFTILVLKRRLSIKDSDDLTKAMNELQDQVAICMNEENTKNEIRIKLDSLVYKIVNMVYKQ